MSQNPSFGRISAISKEEFIEAWKREDEASGHPDPFMEQRRAEHAEYKGLKYYAATLTERGLENVIVGHHVHGQERVKQGGEPLWEAVSHYPLEAQSNPTDECLARLEKIRLELTTEFQKGNSFLTTGYNLGRVFNARDLAVPGEYFRDFGSNALYAGNFHRFVGYALWIRDYGYQPITAYYCERPLA